MFDRKMIFVLAMSFMTLFAFNYFFKSPPSGYDAPQTGMRSGEFYSVLSQEELSAQQEQATLITREIDFIDTDTIAKHPEVLTTVQSNVQTVQFTNYGGTIASIAYPQRRDKFGLPLQSITHKEFDQREESCLLLAMQEETPFFYTLIGKTESDDFIEVSYQASWKEWLVTKTFLVDKDEHRIRLKIACTPQSANPTPLKARLFYPSPYLDGKTGGAFFAGENERSLKNIGEQDMYNVTQQPSLLGAHDKYFAHALTSDHDTFAHMAYFKKSINTVSAIAAAQAITSAKEWTLDFYFGPKDLANLNAVDTRLEGLLNFGVFGFVAKWLLALLSFLFKYLGNYGLAIIALTLLIKLPLLPLSIKAGSVRERQQKYAPHIARIRQQYKSDPQRMMAEMSRFHKEHNISPAAPVLGCLPMLIDIPIMIALWNALGNYVDLYQAPFYGWITDLSAPDPFYVLPIAMGLAMFWQQTLTPTGDQKLKVVGAFMAVVFTAVSMNFAAGLVLYWLVKNVLNIGEHYLRKAIGS